jgi:FlaA1/EpsC-like NDP-sugar epimerase
MYGSTDAVILPPSKEVMANHTEAEITEVVIVLTAAYENRMAEAVEKLKAAGMEIDSTDDDNDVVNGEIESAKLDALRKVDCVNYIRTVMTYIAEYPPGDPRNTDAPDDDD